MGLLFGRLVRLTTFGLVAMGVAVSARANDVLYVCVSPDGVRTYKNTDIGKDCEPLSTNPITIVPSPSERATSSRGAVQSPGVLPTETVTGAAIVEPGNSGSERLRIVQQELEVEQVKLEQLEKEFNGGQPERLGNESNYQKYIDRRDSLEREIRLSRENIKLLRKELRRLGEG